MQAVHFDAVQCECAYDVWSPDRPSATRSGPHDRLSEDLHGAPGDQDSAVGATRHRHQHPRIGSGVAGAALAGSGQGKTARLSLPPAFGTGTTLTIRTRAGGGRPWRNSVLNAELRAGLVRRDPPAPERPPSTYRDCGAGWLISCHGLIDVSGAPHTMPNPPSEAFSMRWRETSTSSGQSRVGDESESRLRRRKLTVRIAETCTSVPTSPCQATLSWTLPMRATMSRCPPSPAT
jgi:hypothetical protein